MSAPIFLLVELWGTAPQSNIYGGKCKFLSYNHEKQRNTHEIFRQGENSYQGR